MLDLLKDNGLRNPPIYWINWRSEIPLALGSFWGDARKSVWVDGFRRLQHYTWCKKRLRRWRGPLWFIPRNMFLVTGVIVWPITQIQSRWLGLIECVVSVECFGGRYISYYFVELIFHRCAFIKSFRWIFRFYKVRWSGRVFVVSIVVFTLPKKISEYSTFTVLCCIYCMIVLVRWILTYEVSYLMSLVKYIYRLKFRLCFLLWWGRCSDCKQQGFRISFRFFSLFEDLVGLNFERSLIWNWLSKFFWDLLSSLGK